MRPADQRHLTRYVLANGKGGAANLTLDGGLALGPDPVYSSAAYWWLRTSYSVSRWRYIIPSGDIAYFYEGQYGLALGFTLIFVCAAYWWLRTANNSEKSRYVDQSGNSSYFNPGTYGLALGIVPFSAQAASWWLRSGFYPGSPGSILGDGRVSAWDSAGTRGLALGFILLDVTAASWWLRTVDGRMVAQVNGDHYQVTNTYSLALGFCSINCVSASWWLRTFFSMYNGTQVSSNGGRSYMAAEDGRVGLALGFSSE